VKPAGKRAARPADPAVMAAVAESTGMDRGTPGLT
jgi:hypothetical protein